MSRMFKGSVAMVALAAVLAAPVAGFAQTATPAPAPAPATTESPAAAPAAAPSKTPAEAPAAASTETPAAQQEEASRVQTKAALPPADAEALPQVLKDLNLSDLKVKGGKRGGKKIMGTLADGSQLRAMIDDKGALIGAFADEGKVLPQALAEALVPETIRNQQLYGQFATIVGAMNGERGVMVLGQDSDGQMLRAGFTQDGTLMRFGRGGEDGPRHDRGDRWGRHGERGDRGDRGWGHHGKGDHDRPFKRGADMTDEAAAAAATAAGYTEAGKVTRDGPRILVEAKNPQGEPVSVEIGPKGKVMRETAR